MAAFKPALMADVRVVPPQLGALASLLGLKNAAPVAGMPPPPRLDQLLAQLLPKVTANAFLRATVTAQNPNLKLPILLPPAGGPMVALAIKLAASPLPLHAPAALIAELKQMIASMMAQLMPRAMPIKAMPRLMIKNMTMAARLTLALRAQGICPMALAGVDGRFALSAGLAEPRATFAATVSFAATLKPPTAPVMMLPPPQLALARLMASLAPLQNVHVPLGLPPVTSPQFVPMFQNLLAALAAIPAPPMPMVPAELLALASLLEALSKILEAFGQDALTPAGVARVNAMLAFVARLDLPKPPVAAIALQAKLDALPKIEAVRLGGQMAQVPLLALSLTTPPPAMALAPLLDAIRALHAVLSNALKTSPFGPCVACKFPI